MNVMFIISDSKVVSNGISGVGSYVASSHLVLQKIGKQRLSYIINLSLKSNPYSKLDFGPHCIHLGRIKL
jgi:hypothetical protein